jgi:hypothetical protein
MAAQIARPPRLVQGKATRNTHTDTVLRLFLDWLNKILTPAAGKSFHTLTGLMERQGAG